MSLLVTILIVRSHPVRGAWIEIFLKVSVLCVIASHPVRGAWIEIHLCGL